MDMKPIYHRESFRFKSTEATHSADHVVTVALKPFVPAKPK